MSNADGALLPSIPKREGDPIRVLHVDDDPALVGLTVDALERLDDRLVVETATSASDALDRLYETEIDCVISDYGMPGMDGLRFLESVRMEKTDLPFILFTGKGSEEIASDAISAGVTDYFEKGGSEQYAVLANRIVNAVERYRARQEADQTRRWYQTLFENAVDTVAVLDDEGRIKHVTAAVEDELGYLPSSLLEEHLFDYCHPDDRSELQSQFQRCVDGQTDTIEPTEVQIKRDDGGWQWIEMSMTDRTDTIVDGYVVHLKEITDRKRLKRRSDRQRAVLDSLPDGVFSTDGDGVVTYLNDRVESAVGRDRDELLGQSVSTIFANTDADGLRSALEASESGAIEATVVGADGDSTDVVVRLRTDEAGAITGTIRFE
ncbi:MAG: PAS domain S-box protein [Natronomonas sp.]